MDLPSWAAWNSWATLYTQKKKGKPKEWHGSRKWWANMGSSMNCIAKFKRTCIFNIRKIEKSNTVHGRSLKRSFVTRRWATMWTFTTNIVQLISFQILRKSFFYMLEFLEKDHITRLHSWCPLEKPLQPSSLYFEHQSHSTQMVPLLYAPLMFGKIWRQGGIWVEWLWCV